MPTLHWIGKEKVMNHHRDVPFRVLEHQYAFTAGQEAKKEPTKSGNKIIHGDNLEALKALLPEYEGKVKGVKDFGCFVEILPGTDGLIHISEFSWEKTAKMEDVAKEGDVLKFKVVGKDPKTGKWKFMRKYLCAYM